MPTCENCGHSKSGQWFKNKICPNCEYSQTTKKIEESSINNNIQNIIIEEKEEKEDSNDFENLFEVEETNELYGSDIATELPQEEIVEDSEKTEKTTLSVSMWESLTTEIYATANDLLKGLNPEFYESENAKRLQATNIKLSAAILAQKEVNPIVLLAFSNILYILPAIKGLFSKSKTEEIEEKETEE